MKVKTYKTRSLHEGLEDIKRDLGSEALILSTRSVSVRPPYSLFKKQEWEITAALEEKPAVVVAAAPAAKTVAAVYNRPQSMVETSPAVTDRRYSASTATAAAVAPARIIQRDPRMEELIGEIGELKKSFRSLSKAIPAKSETGGGLFAELVTNGIDHDWADHLITTASRGNPAPSELRERVRRLLADQLIIAPPVELRAKTRIVSAFVGPTGVGK